MDYQNTLTGVKHEYQPIPTSSNELPNIVDSDQVNYIDRLCVCSPSLCSAISMLGNFPTGIEKQTSKTISNCCNHLSFTDRSFRIFYLWE